MIVSVLLAATLMQLASSRGLPVDDIANEISVNPIGNLQFETPKDWVHISTPPLLVQNKNFGSHVEMGCEAMGSPAPTIQWYKGNLQVTANLNIHNNLITQEPYGEVAKLSSKLIINYMLPRHQGVYRCVATSGSKTVSATTKLFIINKENRDMNFTEMVKSKVLGSFYKPEVTYWAPTYMSEIGNDVTLPCTSSGNPRPTIIWFDPNNRMVENNDKTTVGENGELTIRSIEWTDMGVYNCVAENHMGEDTVETFLYPLQTPASK